MCAPQFQPLYDVTADENENEANEMKWKKKYTENGFRFILQHTIGCTHGAHKIDGLQYYMLLICLFISVYMLIMSSN